MSDCLFCKIAAGDISNYTVYQDEHVLAFLDIHPCAKGHMVVIPKKHFASLLHMSTAEWQQLSGGLQGAIKRLEQVLAPDGLNIGINERSAAGQAVAHVHWHIIPRYEGDGGGSMHSIVRSKDAGDVKEIAKLFV
ncbi:MAG: HIT family protein [Candidatus Magasanikbacteria bacterium]|nr:HIT family protein [Candidatus Magasanikbacteria bacterium]